MVRPCPLRQRRCCLLALASDSPLLGSALAAVKSGCPVRESGAIGGTGRRSLGEMLWAVGEVGRRTPHAN